MVLEGFQINDGFMDTVSIKSQASAKEVEFQKYKNLITDEEAIRTDPGAQSRLEEAQSKMEEVLQWFESENETLKATLQTAQSSAFSFSETLNRKKKTVDTMRKQVEEEREIHAIRQEQVASLQNRYEANNYTSWMGLTRPLEEGSRVGLVVAAGAFLLLGLIALYTLYRVSGVQIPDFFRTGFRGGARKLIRTS